MQGKETLLCKPNTIAVCTLLEKLPTNIQVFRAKTVTVFLKSGVALNKVDCFHDLLEENGYALSSSQHLRELIPPILSEECRKISEEISQRPVSLMMEQHVAEAVVILRFVDNQWTIQQSSLTDAFGQVCQW